MANFSGHAEHRRFGLCGRSRTVAAWLVLVALVCLPGCRGCKKTPEQIEKEKQEADALAKKKKKEEEIKPFESKQPHVVPWNSQSQQFYKPGHWLSQTWPDVKSNLGDFQGELQTEVVDGKNQRVPLVGVAYEISSERPAALAKQQQKSLDTMAWIPPRDAAHKAASVNFKLAFGSGIAHEGSLPLTGAMPSYRYFFVVLTKGARFEYLAKRLDCIELHQPHANKENEAGPKFYEVVTLPANKRPVLPASALCWTSIAYLLWDDSDPALWDLDQQQALLDWLHWGGQIIVSGPDALEQLQTSFLRPYLPATVGKARTFTSVDLAPLQPWDGEFGLPPRVQPKKPWAGAVLKKEPGAEEVPGSGDNLVVERRVGRGRIVVTAFRITGDEFIDWKGCDSFFNACLMRRGPREFVMNPTTDEKSVFRADKMQGKRSNGELLAETIKDAAKGSAAGAYGVSLPTAKDAAANTGLRYFTRDAGVDWESFAADVGPRRAPLRTDYNANGQYNFPPPDVVNDSNAPDDEDVYGRKNSAPGVGAWNDFSPVAAEAQKVLTDAARIKVPERSFIVWVIVGYICVLVPVNWLFFRLIGRVEWAWIAAPLIAVGCTVVVIQQAQLNIGFARSRTEIAVIELQPGYSRAHETRYTALYTSLATRYEFRLDDPNGQVLPFAKSKMYTMRAWESRRELICRRGDDTRLTGFDVGSNVADCVHSEEMADFGGAVTMHRDSDGSLRVTNGSKHPLENCRVVRLDDDGSAKLAKVGPLEAGGSAELNFTERYDRKIEAVMSYPNTASAGEPSVAELAQLALARQDMRPGEVCLVARVADGVPGLTVLPTANQTQQAALLVAHLDAGRYDDPEPDVKLSLSALRGAPPVPASDDSSDDSQDDK